MLRALETFHVEHATIVAHEIVDDADPIVAGREHLFERVEDDAEPTRRPRIRTRKGTG